MKLAIIEAEDEDDWLDMLSDRDNSVHTYNEQLAEEMEERIKNRFASRLASLSAL